MNKYINHIITPLLLGGLLYLLFRPTNLLMFEWIRWVGAFELLETFRQHVSWISLPTWVVYSLPDALWLYAFISFSMQLWGINKTKNLFWVLIPIFIGLGSEFGQFFGLIHGTYDEIDLIVCFIALGVALLLNNYKEKKITSFWITIRPAFSLIGIASFLCLASGSGPADAVQDHHLRKKYDVFYHKPPKEAFLGEWEIIEPTYKNLEENFGVPLKRDARLVVKKDGTFTLENVPALFSFTEIDPSHYFTTNGTYDFKELQGYWWFMIHIKKNKEVPNGISTNIRILKDKENSKLRLMYRRGDSEYIIFEKME